MIESIESEKKRANTRRRKTGKDDKTVKQRKGKEATGEEEDEEKNRELASKLFLHLRELCWLLGPFYAIVGAALQRR